MTFSTHPLLQPPDLLFFKCLDLAPAVEAAAGRSRAGSAHHLLRALSRLSGSWRTFFLSLELGAQVANRLGNLLPGGPALRAASGGPLPWWSGAGSAESFCCASRRASASWARRRFSSAATRSWIRSSRAWRRETSVWGLGSAPARARTCRCRRESVRVLTFVVVSMDSGLGFATPPPGRMTWETVSA